MPSCSPTPPPSIPQYCDRRSLQDAVRNMAFHAQLPSGSVGVDYAAVIDVLQDVVSLTEFDRV